MVKRASGGGGGEAAILPSIPGQRVKTPRRLGVRKGRRAPISEGDLGDKNAG